MAKKKSTKGKDYFGINWFVSIILAIIPITSWILGFITRFKEKKPVAGIVRILLGWNIIWLVDLILMIFKHKIWRLINA